LLFVEYGVTRPASAIAEALKRTWIDQTTGEVSVPHLASVMTLFVLSAAFMKNMWTTGKVEGLDYIWYAVAMAAAASPALMQKLVNLKFGRTSEEKSHDERNAESR